MLVFFGAARIALARFDPYLGSYALAAASQELPPGTLIAGDAYYAFSSFYFYPTLTRMLGATLIRDQVVSVRLKVFWYNTYL